ncbi:unnamed protein product [Brassica napus]|uniref:(rape) hypothetical protein n=1 Tax=Brassica napus TaxID=3708 RepID=A0A816SRQ2_BRANA|nr:unnamed protein product [Brassica napus]
MQPQSGGKFRPRLNMGERPIANKYREVKMKRTLKREITNLQHRETPQNIFGKQNWRCRMNRKPGYGAQLRANLEPTKGVGRLRQQDGGHGSRNPLRSVARPIPGRRGKSQASMSRRARRLLQNLGCEPGRSGRRCRSWWYPETPAGIPERVVCSLYPLVALENLEVRVPLTPGRTHNRIRSPRQGKSAKWIRNFGKRIGSEGWARGSQFRTRRLLAGCLS